ncbi:MAG TPA: sensor histidine kinase KdpD [bacterium]|nr:sensor histidine kinase KdpD [bacterium]
MRSGEAERPRPEAFLREAETEERRRQRGKLKLFLGYAAGVGKTYAMLEAARAQVAHGRRVLIAYVETHGRAETEALLTGLPMLPRRRVEYRGVALEELDLDGVLAAGPDLAIIDELAHTNAPGSRHPKRCQDVEEVLAAGIDVFTTLNVQHIESLNDVVAQITGITVRETIPDRIVETADEVELVDVSPDELIERLREGKVYVPGQAVQAIQKFFRPGNLTALRELALRYLAGHVDQAMRAYMGAHAIPGPWPAGERVLVCVNGEPIGERLVRAGRRLAAGLDAEWIVLHVETSKESSLSEAALDRIARTLRLGEELGARTVTLPGVDPAEEIIRYARAQNVTKIFVGASHRPRWVEWFRESVVDRVMRASGAMDVYVVSSPAEAGPLPAVARPARRSQPRRPYLYSIAIVAAVTAVSLLVRGLIDAANLTMLYMLAVVIVALQWGRGPAVTTATLGVLAYDFFIAPPRFSFRASDTQYLLTFAGLLVVGLVISTLAGRAREQAQAVRRREAYTTVLYALSNDLAAARDVDRIVDVVLRHLAATFGRDGAVLLPAGESLRPALMAPKFPLDENELAVATYAFRHGEPAGYGTDTLPGARARYLPLKTAQAVVGVLGITRPPDEGDHLTQEQRRLLQAFASQAALAIERANLADVSRRLELSRETERLQSALLNSISHDLRTPLASITGAVSSLVDADAVLDAETRRELLETAKEQADYLNRLVGNLLEMTRLGGGAVRLRLERADIEDLVGAVLTQMGDALTGREIKVAVEPNLPQIPMDFVLMIQALINVLDNALRYTPPTTAIDVRAWWEDGQVCIQVADRGPGVPHDQLNRIFDKFHRIRRPGDAGGVGLGLTIAAGIVELHGGRIWAENRGGGGLAVTVALPLGASRRPSATEAAGA